jgi:uncharacterized protein (TIGR00369 family)
MPAGSEVVTIEYKINFIRAAQGTRVAAEGVVLRAGRQIVVGRADITVLSDDGQRLLCAVLQASFMRIST